MAKWQVQDAEARFGEVVKRAQTEGPQTIMQHDRAYAVLLSIEDYRVLLSQQPDVRAALLGGPKLDDFSIQRESDTGR